jgi:hypothetical protein
VPIFPKVPGPKFRRGLKRGAAANSRVNMAKSSLETGRGP